jgi:hypothetical protein
MSVYHRTSSPLSESKPILRSKGMPSCSSVAALLAGSPSASHRCNLVPSCHRRLLSALQHQTADCLIPLDPGVVVRLRPVLPEKVREGLQQDRSDEGVMLWPDAIGDVPLAQLPEHSTQHFGMLHVLDEEGQRLLQFLALLEHVSSGKEGSRFGGSG